MLLSLIRAAGDMVRPALLGLVLRALGLTVLVLLALQALAMGVIRAFAPDHLTLPWLGEVALRDLLSWGSLALLPVMAFLLMAPVAAAMCGLMTDQVAARVEAVHYPSRPGRDQPLAAGLAESLTVLLAVAAVALLSLLLAPVLGPLSPLLFYGANGWLLGREFFQAAASRHVSRADASALRRARAGQVTATGVVIALLLTVPVLNIVIPVLAMAAFTHLYHRLSGAGSGPRSGYPRG